VHRVSQFRARVLWLVGTAGSEPQPLGTGSWGGAGGPRWQSRDIAGLGGHHLDQGCSWLGTHFMVLVGKRSGEGAGDGGVD